MERKNVTAPTKKIIPYYVANHCLNRIKKMQQGYMGQIREVLWLTLKVPITTAADDIYKYFFIVFQRN